jgi:hypothetical protein
VGHRVLVEHLHAKTVALRRLEHEVVPEQHHNKN